MLQSLQRFVIASKEDSVGLLQWEQCVDHVKLMNLSQYAFLNECGQF